MRIANEKIKLLRYIFLNIIKSLYGIFGIGKYNDITVKKCFFFQIRKAFN